MTLSVAAIFRDAVTAGEVRASKEQWRIITDILRCRTAELGGHLFKCTSCGTLQPLYNSCRNRHCPTCQGSDTAKWLAKRAQELLNVPYFHLVFTVPHELNWVTSSNRAVVYDVLMKASAEAIQKVAKRSLNGQLGFFSVLHTWTQKLLLHPHVHTVVAGAILGKDGSIRRTRKNYLVSRAKLAIVFRAVYLRLLRQAYDKGQLLFTDADSAQNFNEVLTALGSTKFVVYAKQPFHTPECVLKYLSLYTHRIAISISRLRSYQAGNVSFAYRDRDDGYKECTTTIPRGEFVRRFLLHTLPPQFVRIRHYGFLANGVRAKQLKKLRAELGTRVELISPQKPADRKCSCCQKSTLTYVGPLVPASHYGSHAHKSKQLSMVT